MNNASVKENSMKNSRRLSDLHYPISYHISETGSRYYHHIPTLTLVMTVMFIPKSRVRTSATTPICSLRMDSAWFQRNRTAFPARLRLDCVGGKSAAFDCNIGITWGNILLQSMLFVYCRNQHINWCYKLLPYQCTWIALHNAYILYATRWQWVPAMVIIRIYPTHYKPYITVCQNLKS